MLWICTRINRQLHAQEEDAEKKKRKKKKFDGKSKEMEFFMQVVEAEERVEGTKKGM